MNDKPLRAEGVELEQMSEGFMAMQTELGRVHYMNHTAAIVFELCDGETTEDAIALALQELYDLDAPPRETVTSCLATLREQKLVT
jgi:hypothetical protein